MERYPEIKINFVDHLKTKVSAEKEILSNLFVINAEAGVDFKILSAIKSIHGFSVSFESRRSTGIPQCKRCQRFGHSAVKCSLQWRCVKCGGSHDIGKCVIQGKTDESAKQLKCANCSRDHAPSYSQCPKRIAYAK